ncbi:peptidase S28 [Pluteus cervinus]|uniref:Peptidase S28 n=1 Tax=Pluteus cervinus TaxID=181527 RepID=A0ACD3ALW8_9AGAR|nr:peptidase S28 [Pluteus cervinus]
MLWKYGILALLAPLVSSRLSDGRLHGNMRPRPAIPIAPVPDKPVVISKNGTVLPPYTTIYYFNQLIDHNNPSLGTFQQRFWFTYEFYEPGGPIILMTPGEANADGYEGYLTNTTMNGLISQQENGATIIIEHRFFGLSNPYPDLTVSSLKLLNIQQAIDDLVYFAENVNLPMPGGDQVTPTQAPWILIGGSYSGALTSWAMVNKPGVFWAGYSSSGVVQAILDFWQYFEPVREGMPKNCSADVEVVIAHVDDVLSGSDTKAINGIKANFGLSDMTHLDDVAGALRNNLWDWQSLQLSSGAGTVFTQFCDALEVKDGKSAGPEGWGLDHALSAWGAFWRNGYLKRVCSDPKNPTAEACLGTYNTSQPFWTDTSIDNDYRSWNWFVCKEVGWLQNGAPTDRPTLVSRLVPSTYDMRQCQQMFPEAFPEVPVTADINNTNTIYAGWNAKIDRIFFVNGQRDPWRDATMSAEGLGKESTPTQVINLGDGFHCSDISARAGVYSKPLADIQKKALATFHTWVSEYKPTAAHGSAPPRPVASTTSDEGFVAPHTSTVGKKPISAWQKGFF